MRLRPMSVFSVLLSATLAVPLEAQSPPTGVIETVAGTGCQSLNGAATSALFNVTSGVTVDKNGNVFAADFTCLVKINSAGQLTVVAGTGVAAFLGDGGPATSAALDSITFPNGLAVDGSGNIFFADSINNVVRQVTAATGVINTVAGNGTPGFVDNVPATSAEFNLPVGVALDSSGNYFIVDGNNCLVRRVDAIKKTVTTVAGSMAGAGTGLNCGFTSSSGPATNVQMSPIGIAVDSVGTLFIADVGDCLIWAVSGGNISVVAGTTNGAGTGANCNFTGDEGPAISAQLNPSNVAVDAAGNLFIADGFNIREVFCADSAIPCAPPSGFSAGEIISVAGNGNSGFSGDGGPATSASLGLYASGGVAVDGFGNLFIGDSFNVRIREVFCANSAIACTPPAGFNPGDITTRAGGGSGGDGGEATSAALDFPRSLADDASGNIFFAENDSRVRRIDAVSKNITTVVGNGIPGFGGDNGPATNAGIGIVPSSITFDGSDNLFIADTNNQRIREVFCMNTAIPCTPPAGLAAGDIITVAGNGTAGFSGEGGLATNAELSLPSGAAVDASGDLFIADTSNQRIREVFCTNSGISCKPPAGLAAGDITTVAGNGTAGFSGDGGLATNAQFNTPSAVIVDRSGNLFIADRVNARVRRIDASTGIITTVAGNGVLGLSGDGGPATSAAISLSYYESLAMDSSGNLFIAVQESIGTSPSNRVRRVDAVTGFITTVAGGGSPPDGLGDGLLATSADFTFHTSVAVDNAGHLFIGDHADNRVREVRLFPAATPSPTTLSFAAQPVGVTSAPQSVKLTNQGASALNVTGAQLSDPVDFLVQQNGCLGTLGGGAGCTVAVTFTPSSAGPFNATITISDNAVNNPQLVQLTGTGAEFVLSSPASTTPVIIASAGQPGAAPIMVTAGNGFSGTVNFTCTVSPLNLTDPPTCSLNPASATLTSTITTGQSTVMVNTTPGQTASLPPASRPPGPDWLARGAGGISAACAFLLLVPARKRQGSMPLLALLLFAIAAGGVGCGGRSSSTTTTAGGTTSGPYTITVTGTSGNLVQTTTVLVNVQ